MSDKELFERIVAGAPESTGAQSAHALFVADRAELAVREARKQGCRSSADVLKHLGRHFRITLPNLAPSDSDMDVGALLLERCVFIHLCHDTDKFNLLLEMLNKLYALANVQCCEDNPDALTNQVCNTRQVCTANVSVLLTGVYC